MENKKIEDYIILTSNSRLDLKNDVLEKIKEGYVPCGGVSITDNYGITYAQAMIKYQE
jgi:hypothetical protein